MANDEIQLALAGGERIVSLITSDRSLAMRLELGRDAIALIRASSVILTTDDTGGLKLSARNLLSGTIKDLHTDFVSTEVVIAPKEHDTLVAIVTTQAAKELALSEQHRERDLQSHRRQSWRGRIAKGGPVR